MIRSLSGTPMWTGSVGEWVVLFLLSIYVFAMAFILYVEYKEKKRERTSERNSICVKKKKKGGAL